MLILDIFSHAPGILLPEWLASGRPDASPLSGHPCPPRLPRMLLILSRLFQKKVVPHATLCLHVPHAIAAPATRDLHACVPTHGIVRLAPADAHAGGDRYVRGDYICMLLVLMLQHETLLQRTYETDETFINIRLQHMCIATTTSR
jgi:hypothetical protein